MKRNKLENSLKELGWWFLRHGGKHDIWTNGERHEPIPRHSEINERLARSIIRKAKVERFMRFSGKVFKDGSFWLAEIPILDIMTQGHTEQESYDMALDVIKSMVNKDDFEVEIYKEKNGNFEIASPDSKTLISLLLQRKREISGLSLSQVATRLGLASRNSYARYEKGQTMPTLGKLSELLRAVDPDADIVINDSNALTRASSG